MLIGSARLCITLTPGRHISPLEGACLYKVIVCVVCVWTDRFLGSEFLDGEVSLRKGFAAQFAYSVKLGLSSNRLLEG